MASRPSYANTAFWLVPGAVLVLCAVFAAYSLLVPNQANSIDLSMQHYLPAVSPKMLQYSRLRYAIHFGWMALDTVFLLAFLHFGLAGRLRDVVSTRLSSPAACIALFVTVFSLVTVVACFPFSFLTGFWLKHQFGLSSQSFVDWIGDVAKAVAVNLAIEIPLWQ